MTRNKYILAGFLLLAAIIFLNCGQSMAVVPTPISTEEKPKVSVKEERLLEIIEKIEVREEADIKFYQGIKDELKEILKKEGGNNEG